MSRSSARWAVGLAVGLGVCWTGPLPRAAPEPPQRARPKLLVVLVVDQFRADYIQRYGHEWTGGLRRLLDSGAWFSQAAFPYFNTVTCPGHATIGTGSLPSTHGMILNEWWDRAAGRRFACTADETTPLVSHGPDISGRGESPRRLLVPTLADELRAQLPGSPRVMTFSIKARSAIGLAGHGGDAVVWFDSRGAFVTSTAFAAWPVPAVAEFAQRNAIPADVGQTWDRLLPADRYLFESPAVGARPDRDATPAFPHPLAQTGAADRSFYTRWQESPYSDAYLARMALHVARTLGAGSGNRTDFLGVSFSALDLVGHNYGPRSHEVQDVLHRLDRTMGGLLDGLDALVGANGYVVALSADHGVAPVPEYATTVGLDAGRRTSAAVSQAAEEVLEALGPERHVAATFYTDVYLTDGTWPRLHERPDLIRELKGRLGALDGVSAVFTRGEMETMSFPEGSVGGRMARGYFPGRSGDLLVAQRPYWIASSDATTHGSGYGYDARVPLVFMGEPFLPGEYLAAATPADVAPTLAHLAGGSQPHAQGRVLREALKDGR